MIVEAFDRLVAAVETAAGAVYDDRLESLVVFGSVARGTARSDSDLDLLLVADPLPDGRLPRMDEFDAVERGVAPAVEPLGAEGVTTRLSPIVCTVEELGGLGFLRFDIACEGVVVFDRRGAVGAALAVIRDDLRRRGAVRAEFRGAKYWVLDPHVRPGPGGRDLTGAELARAGVAKGEARQGARRAHGRGGLFGRCPGGAGAHRATHEGGVAARRHRSARLARTRPSGPAPTPSRCSKPFGVWPTSGGPTAPEPSASGSGSAISSRAARGHGARRRRRGRRPT